MANSQGKFIVIDGTDGSGKATQTDLLIERLKQAGYRVEKIDFPQYGKKSAGAIEEYLNGRYGDAKTVGPYRASLFYAIDRYDASFRINEWLAEGKIVIANRYAASNMGHQGGKIPDPEQRRRFFDWLDKIEFTLFAIPRPDLNIILHVDADVAQKLVDNKGERGYLNGAKRDLHEADLDHLRAAERVYLEIGRTLPNMKLIECSPQREILKREQIARLVWETVIELLSEKTPGRVAPPDFKRLYFNTRKNEINVHAQNAPIFMLRVERLTSTAKLPSRAYAGDAGLDLCADQAYSLSPGQKKVISTGLKIAVPADCVGLIWDKGGVAKAGIHTIAGVIDAGFRGEITVNLVNLSHDYYQIEPGQKIAQLLIQKVEFMAVKEGKIEDTTERGQGRFGSSGMF
ncbi:MAG: dUTP diphosphatase [Planctomycetes bacterium]|jgi:dTMP kinase|nr:dUTP diphosphatase [Planctomycetota bacterium]